MVEEVARVASEGPNGNLKWAVAGRSKQKLEKVLEQAAAELSTYPNNSISCAFSLRWTNYSCTEVKVEVLECRVTLLKSCNQTFSQIKVGKSIGIKLCLK